jgi:DNA-binding LytR/AlgR family response regulator
MKIAIKENADTTETTVEILCKIISEDILRLERHVRLFSKTLVAKSNGDFINVQAADIYMIESDGRKTLVYTKETVYETDFRLYELEERLDDCDFMRVSKQAIINLQKISILTPEINRMILATMKNGDKVYISRQYAGRLKKTLTDAGANRRTGQ